MKFTELKKLEKSIGEVNEEINKLDDQVIELEERRSNKLAELNQVKKETENMVNGSVKMDAMKYLKNKSNILTLEGELKDVEMDLKHLKEAFGSVKGDLNTNLFKTYLESGSITSEFNENILEKQKELFKKLQEAEQIVKYMDTLGTQYRDVVKDVDHLKTQYHTFRTVGQINEVHNRFGVKGQIRYNTSITNEKYNFEY